MPTVFSCGASRNRVLAGEQWAPGYRERINGVLGMVGYRGFSWSFATNSIYSLNLNFHSQDFNANNSGYRGSGFQLRCLSE